MRIIIFFTFLIGFASCADNVSNKELQHLNGYWEIEKVIFSDGTSKEYRISTSIDYIEIDGLKGFKKKVHPKFDGTYTTTNDAEYFSILKNGTSLKIYHKNELSEWKEQLKTISKNNFTVVDEENITYMYKRYQPINIQK